MDCVIAICYIMLVDTEDGEEYAKQLRARWSLRWTDFFGLMSHLTPLGRDNAKLNEIFCNPL